jgi:aminoglycoside phosphotransferase (APT) family kinase protein
LTETVVDRAAVAAWMDDQGLGGGAIGELTPLSGGTQNIMISFTRGGRRFVLRRGPEHLRARSNQVIRREMTLLAALSTSDVPHPGFIAGCADESVLGDAVFYLMEPVDGFNASVSLPPGHAADRDRRYRMGLGMIDALATVGTVDYERAGLSGFGKPDGFLERQVPRWLAELDSYAQLAGYHGPAIEGIGEVAEWLERNRPNPSAPGILHGDFHIANVMFAPAEPAIAAIVDWEMATIGDPLLDLGWLLSIWPSADGEDDLIGSALARAGGLPSESDLVARYAELSDRDLSALDWYVVLGCFKLAIVLEGTYARSLAGQASRATGERLHATAVRLFGRARRRCGVSAKDTP